MTKKMIIVFLIAIAIIHLIIDGHILYNAEVRTDLYKTAYERERAEVLRQYEQMIGFGIPLMQIDPNNPLRVIPK